MTGEVCTRDDFHAVEADDRVASLVPNQTSVKATRGNRARLDDVAPYDGGYPDERIPTYDICSRFPSLRAHQSYDTGSLKARLVDLLNECLLNRRFPRSHNRLRINRSHFARLLGVTSEALFRYNNIFSSYDEILESLRRQVFWGNRLFELTEALVHQGYHFMLPPLGETSGVV